MNHALLLLAIFALFSASIAFKPRQVTLPNGYYEVEHYGDGFCKSKPSRFTFKQLDVCAIDVHDVESRVMTTCNAKGFETRSKCVKTCEDKHCATVTSGEIGCIQIDDNYSLERTCGAPPASLTGFKWLLRSKSDVSNCTGSVLLDGNIADGSCIIRGLDYGQTVECTDTEISWGGCDKPDCGKSFCHFSIESSPAVGVCKKSEVSSPLAKFGSDVI